MTYYSMDDYKLIGFEKSKRKYKKYDALIKNKNTKKLIKIPFGDTRYQQYKDSTGLGLYTDLNHNDKQRRMRYITRHRRWVKDNYYSPSFFSMYYLW